MPSTRFAVACATSVFAFTLALAAPVPQSSLDAARALYDTRQDAEAQHAYEAIVAADPASAEAPRYLGRLALRRDDPATAVKWFETAIALAPDHGATHRMLGDAYGMQAQRSGVFSKLGWAKKCLAAYERAISLDPNDADSRASLFEYYRQAPAIAGGGRDKAVAQAQLLKQLNPGRGALAFAALYHADKKYAEALAEYEAFLAAFPDDFYINYQVGKLADTTGVARDRGLAALRHCLTLPELAPPNAPKHQHAHWRIGNILKAQGDLAGARAAYEASIARDPGFPNARDALKNLPATQ